MLCYISELPQLPLELKERKKIPPSCSQSRSSRSRSHCHPSSSHDSTISQAPHKQDHNRSYSPSFPYSHFKKVNSSSRLCTSTNRSPSRSPHSQTASGQSSTPLTSKQNGAAYNSNKFPMTEASKS